VAAFLSWELRSLIVNQKRELAAAYFTQVNSEHFECFSTQRLERLNNSIIARRGNCCACTFIHTRGGGTKNYLYENVPPHPFCVCLLF
jgi:hypothetical protein